MKPRIGYHTTARQQWMEPHLAALERLGGNPKRAFVWQNRHVFKGSTAPRERTVFFSFAPDVEKGIARASEEGIRTKTELPFLSACESACCSDEGTAYFVFSTPHKMPSPIILKVEGNAKLPENLTAEIHRCLGRLSDQIVRYTAAHTEAIERLLKLLALHSEKTGTKIHFEFKNERITTSPSTSEKDKRYLAWLLSSRPVLNQRFIFFNRDEVGVPASEAMLDYHVHPSQEVPPSIADMMPGWSASRKLAPASVEIWGVGTPANGRINAAFFVSFPNELPLSSFQELLLVNLNYAKPLFDSGEKEIDPRDVSNTLMQFGSTLHLAAEMSGLADRGNATQDRLREILDSATLELNKWLERSGSDFRIDGNYSPEQIAPLSAKLIVD